MKVFVSCFFIVANPAKPAMKIVKASINPNPTKLYFLKFN